jgi:general secretion pathway protein K
MAHSRRLNRGVVLITTLLVLALLAALAWQMVGRHTILIAQYRQGFAGDQALAYALGAETFARQILHQDWVEGGPRKDTLLEMWAQAVPPFEVDNGFLEIQARDLHGCFNLNSVATGTSGQPSGEADPADPDPADDDNGVTEIRNPGETAPGGGGGPGAGAANNLQRLRQLVRNLNLPEGVADAWRDWVDPDQEITGFGAEDADYLLLDPAYRTASAPAGHVSELRLLKGIEPEMVEALEPSVCTLPTTTLKLNVNTAPPEVLAALNPALNPDALARFTETPRDLDDVAEFTQQFPDLAGAVDALTVSSEYFEVSVRARVDDAQVEMVSVLHRDPGSGRIELLSRDLSKNFQSLFLADPVASDRSP